MEHYFDGLFPKNRHGYFCVFPDPASWRRAEGFEKAFVIGKDRRLSDESGPVPRVVTLREFEAVASAAAGRKIPLSTEDAFLVCHDQGNGYMVYLINPYMFQTRNLNVRVDVHQSVGKVTDILSGEVITKTKSGFELEIPAGLFRLLKVDVEKSQ
jgi:hypothetical protein